jgi:prepilin-type N-terminal cleavage/methylation domain-containing protein
VMKLVKVIERIYSGGEKGFTLIELLVVIGILAALAGVVTLGVTQFIGRGCTEAASTELHNVQTAVAACMIDNSLADCDTTAELETLTYLLNTPHGTYNIDASTGVVIEQLTYSPCVP